jgi:hypothetical protein
MLWCPLTSYLASSTWSSSYKIMATQILIQLPSNISCQYDCWKHTNPHSKFYTSVLISFNGYMVKSMKQQFCCHWHGNWGEINGVQRITWFLITNNIRVEGYSSPCTILDIQQLHIKHLKLLCTKKCWWTHLRKPPFVSVFIQIGAKTNRSSCQLVQVSSVQFSELGIQLPNYNQDTQQDSPQCFILTWFESKWSG